MRSIEPVLALMCVIILSVIAAEIGVEIAIPEREAYSDRVAAYAKDLDDWQHLKFYSWMVAGFVSLVILVFLHRMSLGNSSPFAAVGFFICGPLLGAATSVAYAAGEAQMALSNIEVENDTFKDFDSLGFCVKVFCAGLLGAATVAVVVAILKRDEWFNHRRRID